MTCVIPNFASLSKCHCEERSDEAISSQKGCFAIARNDIDNSVIGYTGTLLKFFE